MDAGSGHGERDITRTGGQPADQLARLLDRAENGEQAAMHLAGVHAALMHYCGLQSCRHTKSPPRPMERRTYRHSFLLPDGGVRVLWELEHDTDADGVLRRWVFTDRGDLAVAEWEADAAFGPFAPAPAPLEEPAGFGTAEAAAMLLPEQDGCRRAYTEKGSPEHARRLLRRAANDNAPGPEVHLRLRSSVAHTIGIVTRRSAVVRGRLVSWSLYEHAFLLPDGTEVSLWEIDHTRTPSGDPVCEVYLSRDAALDTAVRRIEAG
ncbi:DUF6227 family protein [Actinacidiphila guanduensis]|jgi:hypothetical protein|uniref:Uncharacterized protein n=1 Tax=Actinacidiphila guanduensis TaxID=310781 RepID=A0A1H0HSH6_9ACTN|nr:DUF6227 family protein [Actinacidiphila guanduensis]SDO22152.1 hypothetical protein SAMN05216259_108183 [Actinacidiphila guanduensis]